MPIDLNAFSSSCRDQLLTKILPWWFEHAVDEIHGGILNMITEEGERLGTDKFTWSQGRFLWVLSAVCNRLEQVSAYSDHAEKTAKFLLAHGRDHQGRWLYRLTRDGKPIEGPTSIFSDCFAIYGLSEYYRLTGDRESLNAALETFQNVCSRIESPEFRDTAPYPMRRLSMILLETASELSVTLGGDSAVENVASQCADRILERFLDAGTGLIVEFLDRNWNPLPPPEGTLVVPGHAIEAMWFLAHWAVRTGRKEMSSRLAQITIEHLQYGWDHEYGGLVLNRDLSGGTPLFPHSDKKLWWPHTEAIYALALLWKFVKDERLAEWFERVWSWSDKHFPLPGGREWRQRLDRTGQPSTEVVALPVKDPFHLQRSLLLSALLA
jgi:N-acylglucosamine 2-epimerase